MDYLILALATWRISSLLVDEDGPFKILAIIRVYASKLTGAFECIWCMSIWIGIMLTVSYWTIPVYTTWICLPFALSAIACQLDR